jgi:hypothetical protein
MIDAPSDLVLAFFKLRMKKIIIILIVVLLNFSCGRKNEEALYFNYKCILLKTGSEDSFTNDKFHKAVNCKIWLIRSVADTTLVAELNSCGHDCTNCLDRERRFQINSEMYYNKKVGDTLFFNYIGKDRFFKLR